MQLKFIKSKEHFSTSHTAFNYSTASHDAPYNTILTKDHCHEGRSLLPKPPRAFRTKKGTVDQLEEILEIDGVDMIQWGGSDFSMNIGVPGQHSHPDVVKAREYVLIAYLGPPGTSVSVRP